VATAHQQINPQGQQVGYASVARLPVASRLISTYSNLAQSAGDTAASLAAALAQANDQASSQGRHHPVSGIRDAKSSTMGTLDKHEPAHRSKPWKTTSGRAKW
jgi:hypothetical protein